MTSTGAKVAFLACGAVALDTAALIGRRGWDADVHGISSDLHMTPLDIAPAVEAKLIDLWANPSSSTIWASRPSRSS